MIFVFLIFTFFFCASGNAPENNTLANYDPNELLLKIFNINDSMPRAGYGFIKFQNENFQDFDEFSKLTSDQENLNSNYLQGNVKFYEDFNGHDPENGNVKFQESNDGIKKKKRKRKQRQQNYGFQHPPVNGPFTGLGGPNPAFGGQYYRPPRPRPSIASSALSTVTDALTSIALYDDSQCVPRLLCEAAGGGTLGSSGILQTISGLQPLLTLLSAYNGISTNPLFVFGRAVFLGMSSKGNTASCRYAYPLCPTDPEQLVHYLNNHNGGFFRFFNAPHLDQQNVQQFYNQLSQNYGLPSLNYQNQQHYGLYNPSQQNGFENPNLYSGQQNYGLAYPYDQNNIRFRKPDQNRDLGNIQRRIQNKPIKDIENSENFSKWSFPNTAEENHVKYLNNEDFQDYDDEINNFYNKREAKTLKFPENINNYNNFKIDSDRKTKGFSFPEVQSVRQYNFYDNLRPIANNYVSSKYHVNNGYNYNDNYLNIRTVYVVRGNGDPNHPEVIKLRPGENIQ